MLIREKLLYKQQKRIVAKACPFNFFGKNFLARPHDQLKPQGRIRFILTCCDRISTEELKKVRPKALEWRAKIASNV